MTRKIYEKAIYTRTKQTARKVYDRKNNVLPTNNVTLTVDVDPEDAIVTLTVDGVSKIAKSITVEPGTTVEWKAEKEGYVTQEGSETLSESKTVEVTLVAETATLTINPTPSTATVTLTAAGYTQEGNSIEVAKGTSVAIKVEAEGYLTSETTEIVSETKTINVELVAETATLTVSPTPDTATVTLTADGYTQEGNAITVAKGTSVAIKVEAETYKTSETTEIVTGNKLVEIELEPLDTED